MAIEKINLGSWAWLKGVLAWARGYVRAHPRRCACSMRELPVAFCYCSSYASGDRMPIVPSNPCMVRTCYHHSIR